MEQNRYTMETKTTDELRHEIKGATDIEDYLKNNRENLIHYNLTRHLNRLLSQKGISKAEVVRGSLLSKAYVYQIFSGERTPAVCVRNCRAASSKGAAVPAVRDADASRRSPFRSLTLTVTAGRVPSRKAA